MLWIGEWLARGEDERAAVDTLSYGALRARVARVAGGLRAAPGERIAITAAPGLDFVLALHAVLRSGAVAVPVDPRLSAPERALRLQGARELGALPDGEPTAPHDLRGSDPALVLFTSGTTAAAKPVVLTHGNVLHSALGSALLLGLDPGERWLCPLPLAHVGGLMVLLRAAHCGTTALLEPAPFDAPRLTKRLAAGEATLVSLVPTQLARLLDAGLAHPPNLRHALVGGGPLAPALLARALAAGVPAIETYGMTEACSQVSTGGRPLPGLRVTLAPPDGEIVVAGPSVAGEGPLATGDLGRWTADGRLVVTGRKADTIVTGGENVAPQEVEAVLLEHPAVIEAGVHAGPDPEWGERVCAVVVTRAPVTERELQDHVRAHLAAFKVPKSVRFATELPRTPTGKLLRRALLS